MDIDEKRLYEAFGRDAEIPPAVQSQLRRTCEKIRLLDRTERNTMSHKKTRQFIKTFLIAAVLMSLLTVTALAVGVHMGFIESAFGTGVPSREGYERVEVDAGGAEALIGEYIAQVGTSVELGDFTFTIDSAVMDENGLACICYTVENTNGLEAKTQFYAELGEYPPFTVYYKTEQGQFLPDETLEDETLRTAEKQTFVSYIAPLEQIAADDGLIMYICVNLDAETAGPAAQVRIPAEARVEALDFHGKSLHAKVSPVGLAIEMPDAAPILPPEGAQAAPASPVPTPDTSVPYCNLHVDELRIVYADGSEYIVFDDSSHNASKGTASGKTLRFMFNRLVDTDNIEYLVLNGEKLTR